MVSVLTYCNVPSRRILRRHISCGLYQTLLPSPKSLSRTCARLNVYRTVHHNQAQLPVRECDVNRLLYQYGDTNTPDAGCIHSINQKEKTMKTNQNQRSRIFSRFSMLLFVLSVVFIGTAQSQIPKNSLQISGYTAVGGCGYATSDTFCCMTLIVTINRTGTRWFRIDLMGFPGYDPACINWDCVVGGWKVNGAHWTKFPPNPGNQMHLDKTGNPVHIDFETDSVNGWTQGTNIEILLCIVPYRYQNPPIGLACYLLWGVSDFWTYDDDEYPNNGNPIDHNNIT